MAWASLVAAGLVFFAQLGENPNQMAAKAGRVGIDVSRTGGNIVVSAVTPGSSAEQAGLKVGDQVLRIDVENVSSGSAGAATAALRGVYLSQVTLTVLPRGSMLPRTLDVKRDVRLYDVGRQPTVDSDDFKEKGPEIAEDAAPVITAHLTDFTRQSGSLPEEKLRASFGKSPADVATCVGALSDVLPNDMNKVGVTYTLKAKGVISVRTDPPSGDLASCLGRRSANWKLPKPGKDPTVVQIFYSIDRK